MKIALALAAAALLAACSTAELNRLETAASADFAAACRDWQAVQGVAQTASGLLPPPLAQAAGVTEAFVGDACTNQAFIQAAGRQEVTWITQSTANLKAVLAQAPQAPQG